MHPAAAPRHFPDDAVHRILAAYDRFRAEFHHGARRAQVRFEERDWLGAQHDAAERLDLYSRVLAGTLADLHADLGPLARDRATWRALKSRFAAAIAEEVEAPLAETFFNSITRRVFATVGLDPEIDFVDHAPCPAQDFAAVVDRFPAAGGLDHLFASLFASRPFLPGYADLQGDACAVAAAVGDQVPAPVRELEVLRPVFFRNKEAYLIGRLRTDAGYTPLVIALLNRGRGIEADAVLLQEDEVSVVFSFARSYFMVDTNRPVEVVSFLRALLPRKPVSELFNAIGHNRHGKTEFYRALRRHLGASDDRFEIARGVRGMVMIVFTLPSYDVVFKVIRDSFEYPKTTTREDVMSRYRLVFRHDRAGRLVDAQEFEHLEFDVRRFSPELLDVLRKHAAESVVVRGSRVDVKHVYTERRLTPLDIYLREAPAAQAHAAVLDYGQVLRDLAATNIFPGDMLLKNFGVSRHGRVIFYDYDEISFLTDVVFRKLPQPTSDLEESAGEPWFYVGEKDVFPEEFLPFLGLPPALRDAFLAAHRELLTPEFWQGMQDEHRAGRVPDILPYRPERRLPRNASGPADDAAGSTDASGPADDATGSTDASGPADDATDSTDASGPADDAAGSTDASGPADDAAGPADDATDSADSRRSIP